MDYTQVLLDLEIILRAMTLMMMLYCINFRLEWAQSSHTNAKAAVVDVCFCGSIGLVVQN